MHRFFVSVRIERVSFRYSSDCTQMGIIQSPK